MKRQTLLELVDYVNTGTGKFTEPVRWPLASLPRSHALPIIALLPPETQRDSFASICGQVQRLAKCIISLVTPSNTHLQAAAYPYVC